VTAGIDFALRLAAELSGEYEARRIALQLEYDPSPPFGPGNPNEAGLDLITDVQRRAKTLLAARQASTIRAAERLVRRGTNRAR
jgi:cyclohexyl-isocyanide hydratase